MIRYWTFSAAVALLCSTATHAQRLAFELPSITQTVAVQAADAKATAVCFLGTECPMARSYVVTLNKLQAHYGGNGVKIVGVFSNRQDSLDDLANFARELGVEFEVALDAGNQIADSYGATRTPEVFLLDSKLKLRYHGRIDDRLSPGVARNSATREDLRIAIDEVVAGKPVSIRETPALGCIIGKLKASEHVAENVEVTFCKDIVPLLQNNCIECHREGEIGPFAMDRYEEVVGWADTMLETMDNGRMPPWHAAEGNQQLANTRHISDKDKALFRQWIEAGLPEGDSTDLPPAPNYTAGWQLPREPDMVFEMRGRPFSVPRDGVIEYQYFVVDLGFDSDRWISAAQIIPGERSVVHHAIAYLRPPDGAQFKGIGWLTAYVPGQRLLPLPAGYARRVPAGSKLVFQMHYTPNGMQQEDITKVGIVFADEPVVTHEVYSLFGIDQEFEIPPFDGNHTVQADVPWLPKSGQLLAVTPHMHLRGKAFTLFADKAQQQVLLQVPAYDFNWQHTYEFAEPLELKEVSSLNFNAVFDNSTENPFNPAPEEWVAWGDQTWEEMAVAFFEVAEPLNSSSAGGQSAASIAASESDLAAAERKRERNIQEYITKVLSKLDKNADGQIRRSETGIILRRWNFGIWDDDRDDVVTRDELRKVAEKVYPKSSS